MKITIKTIIAIVLFSISMATAQIGINTSNPDDSSMLDVTSTDKGMLVPRMTEAQRIAITLPATGLLVYQTNNTDGFWYYDGSAWVNLNAATGEFQRFGNIVRNTTDTATDDFVFGSTSLDDISGTNDDNRMFFDKSKGAFRVGSVEGSQWNDSNVGNYSTAFGSSTTASGAYSTAFGSSTTASGAYSTAFGSSTTASGFYSTAFGLGTSASGYFSTAIGRFTTASGDFSTAMGRNTYARSYGETALGLFNTDYTPSNVFSFNANDRLFTIGNGTDPGNRSNAMVVLKNGNTGFGTSTPSATLDVEGTFQLVDGNQSAGKVLTSDAAGNATWQTNTGAGEFQRFGNIIRNTTNTATDDFLFGNLDFSDNIDRISRRMFFDKSKGAFRVGGIDGTQWNDANVGIYSTAFGFNTTASGAYSTAMGVFTTASGVFSTALGHQNNAPSVAETTIGSLSTIYTPGNNFAWVPTDRLFTIGNGSTQNFIRSDAMVVLKNGNTGLGTSTPSATLDVVGTFQLVDGNQAAGKVLTSDAFGNATWQNASSDTDWVISGSNLYSGVSGNVGIGTTTPADKLVVSGGRVEFTATTDASGSTGSGVLEIANSLRFDGNEIITNTDSPLYIQNDNNGDLFVDGSTLSVIANTNRVGIGTTTPSDKLVVSGGRVEFTATTDASGTEGTGVLEIGNNLRLDNNEIITNTNSTLYLQRDNNGDLVVDDYTFMVDASANHVGIGTNAPTQAKLVVNGSNGSNIGNHAFFNSSGNTGSSSSTKAYSIYASHNIATAQLNVFSDERIKNIQGITNSKEDLETLAQIEITDYTLKDSIGMGKETIKKVIAQQVKQVYPQAVSSTLTDVIPDIYQLAEIEKGWINLKTDLAVGDKVKLIFSETEDLFEVTEVSTTAFKVNSEQEGKVFVFGKEVQDFHTVDYEAISMLNVSATQELLKRIELLESENSNLKAETANQELQLNALDKRLQLLESNFQNTNNQQSK